MTGMGLVQGAQLAHLVVKPELACTGACPTCSSRKALHRGVDRSQILAFDEWRDLFSDARSMGCARLTISGGEPTLYGGLAEMIAMGKSHGWKVDLNSNGSRIDRAMASRLVNAGLDSALISLYAADAALHDRLRGSPGLWRRAEGALEALGEERDSRAPALRVGIQTLLSRENFRGFPELLELAFRLRVCFIAFSYLEGDHAERKFLLDEKDIAEFKSQVVPRALAVIRAARTDRRSQWLARAALGSLYAGNARREKELALGIYRKPRPCAIPSFLSIVLANGDVHPCNMVEYTHQPVIGNLRERRLPELWRSEAWRDFRRRGFALCRYCPMADQVVIPISRPPRLALLQTVLTGTPLRRFRTGIRGRALRHSGKARRRRPAVKPTGRE
jgi:radical SAM protein with 4Fe4S-binding SPASM domain